MQLNIRLIFPIIWEINIFSLLLHSYNFLPSILSSLLINDSHPSASLPCTMANYYLFPSHPVALLSDFRYDSYLFYFVTRIWPRFICGFFAGACAAVVVNPLEVIRVRQVVAPDQYRGLINGTRQVFKGGGVKAFYEGLFASILQVSDHFSSFRSQSCY